SSGLAMPTPIRVRAMRSARSASITASASSAPAATRTGGTEAKPNLRLQRRQVIKISHRAADVRGIIGAELSGVLSDAERISADAEHPCGAQFPSPAACRSRQADPRAYRGYALSRLPDRARPPWPACSLPHLR